MAMLRRIRNIDFQKFTIRADDPHELQQYFFATIARDLGVSVDVVRAAISDGGYNGTTIHVSAADRIALVLYKHE